MSLSASPHPALAPQATMRSALGPTAVVTTGTALTLTMVGDHDLAARFVLTPVIILTSAVTFGIVVRNRLRRRAVGNAGLTMSALAVLLDVTAYGAGVPLVLGVAGAMLGWAGHSASPGSRKAAAAFALGSVAALSYLAIYGAGLLDR